MSDDRGVDSPETSRAPAQHSTDPSAAGRTLETSNGGSNVGRSRRSADAAQPRSSERFQSALRYAADVHAGGTRKGTKVPYFSHLLGVCSIVLDDGGGEDEAIAALLHDAAEDHGGRERLNEIRERFGDAVAKIVEDCTDSWEMPKKPWLERKQQYIDHARTLPAASVRVSAADKVHNAYAILRDLRNLGEQVWDRFNAKPDDILWYYQSLVRAYRACGGGPLVNELDRIVRGIEREIGY
jgi:(p)ppGpp synthase/HD superfamily hydrolase